MSDIINRVSNTYNINTWRILIHIIEITDKIRKKTKILLTV